MAAFDIREPWYSEHKITHRHDPTTKIGTQQRIATLLMFALLAGYSSDPLVAGLWTPYDYCPF